MSEYFNLDSSNSSNGKKSLKKSDTENDYATPITFDELIRLCSLDNTAAPITETPIEKASSDKEIKKREFYETLIDAVADLSIDSKIYGASLNSDAVRLAWKKSPQYRKTVTDIELERIKNPDVVANIEFRIRGIIYTTHENKIQILLTEKKSVVPFTEMSFKGGAEREDTMRRSLIRENIEEIIGYKDIDGERIGNWDLTPQISGPYIDMTTEEKGNSDIMKRVSSNGNKIVISFLANYFLYAPKPFDLFEVNPLARDEHFSFEWTSLSAVEKKLLESKTLGKDKDYLCFINLVKKIDLKEKYQKSDRIGRYVHVRNS